MWFLKTQAPELAASPSYTSFQPASPCLQGMSKPLTPTDTHTVAVTLGLV